jgi:threonine aldolase
VIDLRSDTVTQPTQAMRQAMAQAELGDDVFREDPTVNRLEEQAAEHMGKEAGLFVPSGTMGNLAAILAHCQRGDEVILGDQSHTYMYEAGGTAALGGVHPRAIVTQPDGRLELGALEDAIRGDDIHFPISRLICLETTHNRCGGTALPGEYLVEVGELVRRHGLGLHLDGARIFNAAAALGCKVSELAEPADSITFCLSKGLCAPVGSVLCGSGDFIARARRVRKQLGGGMRQAGVLAAAGLIALEEMPAYLGEDHRRAALLADALAELPGVAVETHPPQTNMVYFSLEDRCPIDGAGLQRELERSGVLIHPVAARRVRLVTHYWIDDVGLATAIDAFRQVLGGAA